nr:LOW QUALITY PROTEIN: eukaryotic translation initiation factor 5-like [Lepeophtheirus salmonis]
MSLNVNRNVQDNFYRYKMPRIQAKVEGKGNGIKTVIPNMGDVARALGRPPTYTTKYFGCELGAQTLADNKNDRYIVNGLHDAHRLQDILDGFIKKFVLCEKCDNPETILMVKKGIIGSKCKACGHVYTLDMRHKLTAYILKNPPDKSLDASGTSLTQKKRRSKRREQQQKDEENLNVINNDNDDDDWGDEDWGEDTSEEAQRARLLELTRGVKGLAVDADTDKSEVERINIFHDFVKKRVDSNTLSTSDKDIFLEAERLEITNKAPIVLCELVLVDNVLPQIKKCKKLFLRFTHDNQKAQKYLLGGIEKTIEVMKDALLPKTAHILKAFYDEDILDEEVILEWGKKVSKKYVSKELSGLIHKKAEPFLNWLREAEEESDDDSDEVELEFDEKAKISSLKEVEDVSTEEKKSNGTTGVGKSNAAKVEEEDGDDLDIDDI